MLQIKSNSTLLLEFFLNKLFYDKNIFVITVKGLEFAISCVRDQNASKTSASKTHVRYKIFKFSPIHAPMIYPISWIH